MDSANIKKAAEEQAGGFGGESFGLRSGVTHSFSYGRTFTRAGKSPFEYDLYGNPINWLTEDVKITDDMGKTIFVQSNVKRPDFWSPLAIKVVASKYFWGEPHKSNRETNADQMVGRVSNWIGSQALMQRYMSETQANELRDEVAAICLNQLAVFNSPVWFNMGLHSYDVNAGGVSRFIWDVATDSILPAHKTMNRPQCSACFIQSIDDNMESILEVQTAEVLLFKAGSGTGTNRSSLRSCRERLTGRGYASGPVSFMKAYDTWAGVTKSGGKTRRAAKMEILNVDHPDIVEFIESKQREEKKAWALIEQGYDGGMNGEAYRSVQFQNCNMSVRVPDTFMQAVKNDGDWQTTFIGSKMPADNYKARELMRKIAEGTWICGDPGMQFDTVINKWHTSKNTARINASNPCSEYMFLDDSACNLASINLMKFRTEEGKFDVDAFKSVVKTFITSMDIIVDGSSYPTVKICRNSRDYRPLGLGYANLGALLMSLGLSYDSDEGRAVAAAITAIMCGESYKVSAELARSIGPFPGYAKNREPMLEVMHMHRDAVKHIQVNKMPAELRYLVNDAWDSWDEAVKLGEIYGYRNSQTTVLAPTGTIAFMMDCDTTGIEPDIALVKYKVLAGGGMLKIVNRSVPLALKTLGYDEATVQDIIKFIDTNDTIEGAPGLRDEHLSIFDCAFRAAKGKRFIHHAGHIKMMGVCQPFISGAISKTVNMPEHSTVEDIMEAYILSWEQGLKAVAIYRENSKRSQPLNTQKTEGERVKKEVPAQIVLLGERKKLPQTRKSVTHKFDIASHEGYLTVGLYDDGMPGEIFVTMSKVGSTINGLVDSWATSVSLNLQYGIPVEVLFTKFRHQKFEPAGFVKNASGGELDEKNPKIRTASSIVDYVAQFMLNTFSTASAKIEFAVQPLEPTKEEQKSLKDFGNEGLVCPLCGGPAKRIGNCAITCTSCNQTSRSGCGE